MTPADAGARRGGGPLRGTGTRAERQRACAAFGGAADRMWDALKELSVATVLAQSGDGDVADLDGTDLDGADLDGAALDARREACRAARDDLHEALAIVELVLPARRARTARRVWAALEIVRGHVEAGGVVPDAALLACVERHADYLSAVRRHLPAASARRGGRGWSPPLR